MLLASCAPVGDDAGSTARGVSPLNGRAHIQDNLWSTANEQYAVWVTVDGRPVVGKRAAGGAWDTFDLGSIPGNPLGAPVGDDPHNTFVLGVDGLGHVHVAGNAHSSPLQAVRSTSPGSIDDWKVEEPTGSSGRVTYPRFVGRASGELLLFWREGAAGAGEERLAALGPADEEWSPLGTVLDGRPSDESPYLHHVAVDHRTDALHLLFEWRGRTDPSTTNDVGYLRSSDGGHTWEDSTGRRAVLPVTHASAETVVDTAPTGSGLQNDGGLAVDSRGRPHGVVVFDRGGRDRSILHVWHDGRRWHRDQRPGHGIDGRPAVAGTRDGAVWLLGSHRGRLEIHELAPGNEAAPIPVVVPLGWEVVYDTQALVRRGRIEVLVPLDEEPRVEVVEPP